MNEQERHQDPKSDVRIRRATLSDAAEIARVLRESRTTAMPYLPDLHTPAEDFEFCSQQMLPNNEVFVAITTNGTVIGFIAYDEAWVNHLYIDPNHKRNGNGARLLNIAKARRTKLRLWTFQKNEDAREFYVRQGFREVTKTNGAENEEKEPDVLLEWSDDS